MQTGAKARNHHPAQGEMHTLVLDVLNDVIFHATELQRFVPVTAGSFRCGDERRGIEQFIELITGLDWIVKSLDHVGIAKGLDFGTTTWEGEPLTAFAERFCSLLNEIAGAQQRRDWVLLADLLDYELVPFLERWTALFTELKENSPG